MLRQGTAKEWQGTDGTAMIWHCADGRAKEWLRDDPGSRAKDKRCADEQS